MTTPSDKTSCNGVHRLSRLSGLRAVRRPIARARAGRVTGSGTRVTADCGNKDGDSESITEAKAGGTRTGVDFSSLSVCR